MKKENISIIFLSIIFVLMAFGAYGIYINKSGNNEYEIIEIKDIDSNILKESLTNKKIEPGTKECIKKLENKYETYLIIDLNYNDTYAVSGYNAHIKYVLTNIEEYNALINNLSNCQDNYHTNKEIICNYNMSSLQELVGRWVRSIEENLTSDGFSCK